MQWRHSTASFSQPYVIGDLDHEPRDGRVTVTELYLRTMIFRHGELMETNRMKC